MKTRTKYAPSTRSSWGASSSGWRPVVTAPGSNNCSKNLATKSGWATRPRFGAARGWRQKNDRRDAELILDLLVHDEFPRLHRPSLESREMLRMLRYRHKLVKMRTIIKNSLQALALQSGLSRRTKLFTKAGQQELRAAPLWPVMKQQQEQWLELLLVLNQRIDRKSVV